MVSSNQPAGGFPPINFRALADALLASAGSLVPLWLSGGQKIGHEWVCGSLAGGKGRSCSVNLVDGKWADFSADERGGDLLSLYAAIHGLSMTRAAVQVAREQGLESVANVVTHAAGAQPVQAAPNPRPAPVAVVVQPDREGWQTVLPVPAGAPAPVFRHYHRPHEAIVHTAEYRIDGDLHGYVVRFATSDGGKDTLPYTYCKSDRDGSTKWHWRQWDEPRPLFVPSHAWPAGRTVVLVEGEVKAEVLQNLLDAHCAGVYCVVSWPGGSKAWQKADWSLLGGATVVLWPDCDAQREPLIRSEREQVRNDAAAMQALRASKPLLPEAKQPGMRAMLGIGALLRDAHGCTVSLLPIPKPGDKASGWDCKDAIVDDGWTADDVLDFFARAKPLLPAAEPQKLDTPQQPVATGGAEEGSEWVLCGGHKVPGWLAWFWDAEKARWAVSRKLVIASLEKDDTLRGVVAYNEMTNTVQCHRPWPWPHAQRGDIRNEDSLLLGKYLTDSYGLPAIPRAALDEAIQTVAHVQRFHPLRDWLVDLQWDGKGRIDKWLVHALGETPASLGASRHEYLSLVGRFWLLGMVWRVMQPGCKFDYCPVLDGNGGLRKSTLAEVLAGGSAFFSDTPFDVGRGKEAQEQVRGVWLYEIAELSALSKADVNAIKAFVSSKVDKYRVAYGVNVEAFPRQCVLVGTTNEDTYLRDRTGNRRFWPVPVRHQINTEWVQRARDQLFAEAYTLYMQGVPYTPSQEQEQRLFVPMQESRLIETAVESKLLQLLTRTTVTVNDLSAVSVDCTFVTIAQLVVALGSDPAKTTPGLEGQVRGWLKQYGWERTKRQINGARAWGYARPAVWPPVDDPASEDSPAVAVVTAVAEDVLVEEEWYS